MAIIVWWLVRQTVNVKPWLEQLPIEIVQGDGALSLPPVKVGLGVFLAVATSLFALLISAYHMRMMGEDWTRLAVPRVLWLNTAVLILASVAMQWTRVAAQWGQLDRVKNGLIAGGALTFSFLAGLVRGAVAHAYVKWIEVMAQPALTDTGEPLPRLEGMHGIVADWSSDQRAFKNVPWGKAMMWIFLLSDTFIFSSFLISYMTVRMSTTVPWPNPSEVFALTIGGKSIPLILIAIMTFILISSSGTMVLAVNYGYRRDRVKTFIFLLLTAALGATFVGMQAFEWTKLIMEEGVRPWGNPMGAAQFGSSFFMITGFHGTHVSIGVIFLIIVAIKVLRGDLDKQRPGFLTGRKGNYEIVETMGLYWHFVDLVWVFIFAVFYLW